MPGSLPFSCALITSGGGGIGKALASYLINTHKIKVLLAGRTESTLSASAREIGAAGYYVLDVGDTASIAPFVAQITAEHPELDCLINNADGNDSSTAAATINVSSVLGFVPFSIVNPIYNGTKAWLHKAWLHFWSMNLRTQLRATGVAVFEIAPPTVATDLHRERADPDYNNKNKNPGALSVCEFADGVGKRLVAGEDTIGGDMNMDVVERGYVFFPVKWETL
ncbi:short-chain dehydrogenase [Phyllosticta citribraziliensis]|uniref:Short-chain dehydrogenase n=1 Tax=Phyllosticta citribraziliensis TaxID=989973 RepID=A0ABR1LWT3_9PEZI